MRGTTDRYIHSCFSLVLQAVSCSGIMPIDPLEDSLPDLPVQGFTPTCLHLCRKNFFKWCQHLSICCVPARRQLCATLTGLLHSLLEWTTDLTFSCCEADDNVLKTMIMLRNRRLHIVKTCENDDNVVKPIITYHEIDE